MGHTVALYLSLLTESRVLTIVGMRRLSILLFVLLLALAAGAEDKFADVTIKVVKEETGKPIRNAVVVLHTLNDKGKEEGSINLKTDSDGKTIFNNLPYGKLRVQVIARGRKTFGQDYDIQEPAHLISIKLQPPADQYSIYEEHPEQKPPEKKD
jgi:Carboxypeptidase regulatory-like domain